MSYKFNIEKNDFLKRETLGYYHQLYTCYGQPGNPEFINTLKNTFNSEPYLRLVEARDRVIEILIADIPKIIEEKEIKKCMIVAVPRAKLLEEYTNNQLMFKEAIKIATNRISDVNDGTNCIKRIVNTKTTHIRKPISIGNNGPEPYPGITVDTCIIDKNKIINKNIILVDDIYAKGVNTDEDCIQALIDNGANKVIFYSIGFTRRF